MGFLTKKLEFDDVISPEAPYRPMFMTRCTVSKSAVPQSTGPKSRVDCFLKFKDLEVELRKKVEIPESSYVSGITVKEDGIIFLFEEGEDDSSRGDA